MMVIPVMKTSGRGVQDWFRLLKYVSWAPHWMQCLRWETDVIRTDGHTHCNTAIIYVFIIYDILVDRTRSLFSLSLDNRSYSSDVPRTVFFSIYVLHAIFGGLCVCWWFFYPSHQAFTCGRSCVTCLCRRSITSMPLRNNSKNKIK